MVAEPNTGTATFFSAFAKLRFLDSLARDIAIQACLYWCGVAFSWEQFSGNFVQFKQFEVTTGFLQQSSSDFLTDFYSVQL